MAPARPPGHRAGLTHAAVLAAARELLAQRGLPAVSMRALAARLGVAPNAIYSHVADKTALVDDLLDDLLATVDAPAPDVEDPVAGLHQLMASTYRVLLTQPDLVPLYLSRQGARGPNAQHLGDVATALLTRAGVGAPAEALPVLIVHTIGFAAFTSQVPTDTERRGNGDNFDRGLRWLLAGMVPDAARESHRGVVLAHGVSQATLT